ncbi:hypothetical protein PanWU01x14_027140, partial [Parasponia andersonii]
IKGEENYQVKHKSKLFLAEFQQPRSGSVLGIECGNLFLQLGDELLRLGSRRLRGDQLPNGLTLLLVLPLNLALFQLLLKKLDVGLSLENLGVDLLLQLNEVVLLSEVGVHNSPALEERNLEGGELLQEGFGKLLAVGVVGAGAGAGAGVGVGVIVLVSLKEKRGELLLELLQRGFAPAPGGGSAGEKPVFNNNVIFNRPKRIVSSHSSSSSSYCFTSLELELELELESSSLSVSRKKEVNFFWSFFKGGSPLPLVVVVRVRSLCLIIMSSSTDPNA